MCHRGCRQSKVPEKGVCLRCSRPEGRQCGENVFKTEIRDGEEQGGLAATETSRTQVVPHPLTGPLVLLIRLSWVLSFHLVII